MNKVVNIRKPLKRFKNRLRQIIPKKSNFSNGILQKKSVKKFKKPIISVGMISTLKFIIFLYF